MSVPSAVRLTARPRLARSALISSGLLALCALVLGTFLGGLWSVREVDVRGANLPAQRIIAASGVQGQNVFTVQSDQVVERLGQIQDIAVRRVDTAFPGRVIIYARLRTPLVAWENAGSLFLVDPGGQVIGQVRRTRLPIIQGTNGGALGPGVVQAVRYAVQILPGHPDGAIASFRLNRRTGLTIVGRGGWTAVVGNGTPQTLVNRIVTFAAFLDAIRGRPQKLAFVDLRFRVPYARFGTT